VGGLGTWFVAADGGGERDLRALHGVLEAHLASAIGHPHGIVCSPFHRAPAQFIGPQPAQLRHLLQSHGGEWGLPEPGASGALGCERRRADLGEHEEAIVEFQRDLFEGHRSAGAKGEGGQRIGVQVQALQGPFRLRPIGDDVLLSQQRAVVNGVALAETQLQITAGWPFPLQALICHGQPHLDCGHRKFDRIKLDRLTAVGQSV